MTDPCAVARAGLRIVDGADLPPLAFVGRLPRVELFDPVCMEPRFVKAQELDWRYRTPGKPLGGLWTSPLLDGRLPRWTFSAMCKPEPWWRVEAAPYVRVVVLDSQADL